MKTLINTIANTYNAVRLISDPQVGEYLKAYAQGSKRSDVVSDRALQQPAGNLAESSFDTRNAFYHKHYIVQVL